MTHCKETALSDKLLRSLSLKMYPCSDHAWDLIESYIYITSNFLLLLQIVKDEFHDNHSYCDIL